MAISILEALGRIKAEVASWLAPESIQRICQKLEYTWRERILDPVTTIQLFLLQIVHGNTACNHVPRLGGVSCTGEAYGQARARLPLALLQQLLTQVMGTLKKGLLGDGLWHGHRTFLVDGSSVSMPDTPELQKEFGQPGAQAKGCGFPVMHLLALFHAATGFLLQVTTAPLRTHDMSRIGHLHPELLEGDVLVGDRAFCSFAHLALLLARKVHGVFRVHQKQIVDFRCHRRHATTRSRKRGEKDLPSSRWLKRLGKHDQIVEYVKPKKRPIWMTDEQYATLPEAITVRELRFTIAMKGRRTRVITLATTLLDQEQYPAADLAELYGQRWQIETNFRHLKQTLHMDVLHCRTVDGVQKELTMYALVYNLVRLVMREAARRQEVDVARISFIDALRWLAACGVHDAVWQLVVNPERPNRIEPRVRKRRPKQYPLMKKPRDELRKALLHKKAAA
jgi:DDE family transposase